MGAYTKARDYIERTAKIRSKLLGEDHPSLASTHSNLGGLHYKQGAFDEAKVEYEKALRILVATHGEDHPNVASLLVDLGNALIGKGATNEAKAYLERALRIFVMTHGDDHPSVAKLLQTLGDVHTTQGLYEDAKVYYERTLQLNQAALGEDHPKVGELLHSIAKAYNEQHSYVNARVYYARAADVFEKVDPNGLDYAEALADLGVVLGNLRKIDNARAALERAVTVGKRANGGPAMLAKIYFAQAQLLWPNRETRSLARELARQAREELQNAGKVSELAKVEAWLDEHERGGPAK